MKSVLTLVFISICLTASVFAQAETLTNSEIILMTKAGLSRDLIVRKIKESGGRYDTTTQALIELKKAGVADEVIALMLDAKTTNADKTAAANKSQAANAGNLTVEINNQTAQPAPAYSESQTPSVESKADAHVVIEPKEALRAAKTVAITKSSLNPSRQALEKELLKRKEWRQLDLNIVRYKQDADLYIEIGFVPLSIITHRYVFRVYDGKSGTVIAAGETTSWGSLAENLARHISKELVKVL
ncbi:MAG: hypothetical protein M3033_18280 [Acidobacteriota bacterium]|nr:hypothetical protein [Acidobacteriota bacterium]